MLKCSTLRFHSTIVRRIFLRNLRQDWRFSICALKTQRFAIAILWDAKAIMEPPATGLRKPESPKSAGKSAGKKGIVGSSAGQNQKMALLPAVPSAVLFFLALFPALASALRGHRRRGLSQSCSRWPRLQSYGRLLQNCALMVVVDPSETPVCS